MGLSVSNLNDYVWDDAQLLISLGYPAEYNQIGVFGLTEVRNVPKPIHLYDAQKWLRSKGISVQPMTCRGGTWDCQITFCDDSMKGVFDDKSKWVDDKKSYEEALLNGIKLALTLI